MTEIVSMLLQFLEKGAWCGRWSSQLAAHDVAAADRQQGRSPLFSGAIIANMEEVEGARELAMDLGGKQLHVPGIHPQRQGVWKVVDEMRKSRGQVL
jgi:hypothetical protein